MKSFQKHEFCNNDINKFILLVKKSVYLDVFENFKNKCIEIYELDPAHFASALGFARQPCLNKTRKELELLSDIDVIDG